MPKSHGTQTVAHTVLADHFSRQRGCTLQITAGATGNIFQDNGFGHTSAQQHLQFIQHFRFCLVIPVFLGQAHRITAGTAPRYDCNLMYNAHIIVKQSDQSMPGFMICCQLFLRVAHKMAAAFRSHYYPLRRFIHGFHINHRRIAAGSQQRCLIDQVCKIRSGKTGCLFGNCSHIHIGRHGLAFGMYMQNRFPPPHIRTVNDNLPVKPAGAQ